MLLLNPLQGMLTYISCGFDALLHIPQGSTTPRNLHSHNPLLGLDVHAAFSETNDNWNAGDILIMDSLVLPPESMHHQNALESLINETVIENLLLSSQRQAEFILKKISSSPLFSAIRYPKVLISIQRIV